ncbi:uncharacterized protein BDR25DRAFT_309212 [Lindgomyces ingoldianus]|uniref:Uncharacterized protein n=1 Tax=Lindgomyces ingoldianus TaxID=673940 RepID=A0ACB6RCH7_9PLEO|nr:uncharacterized protein BDR25DRAFT_309212 [Lindgomyces ingoldianus]KAF2476861.1 hypothetical protein BDR25DRAFT_309212 [Lindgomyces ingoldianus]
MLAFLRMHLDKVLPPVPESREEVMAAPVERQGFVMPPILPDAFERGLEDQGIRLQLQFGRMSFVNKLKPLQDHLENENAIYAWENHQMKERVASYATAMGNAVAALEWLHEVNPDIDYEGHSVKAANELYRLAQDEPEFYDALEQGRERMWDLGSKLKDGTDRKRLKQIDEVRARALAEGETEANAMSKAANDAADNNTKHHK